MKQFLTFAFVLAIGLAGTASAQSTNNSSPISINYPKSKLQGGTNATNLGGVKFSGNFSRTGATNITDFFKLRIGSTEFLTFSIRGNQFVVKRRVQWKECTNWNSSGCQTFATPVPGTVEYITWDDNFIGSAGWLSVVIANNGVMIKVSRGNSTGPFVADFSYGGLHWSAIEELMATSPETNVTLEIPSSGSSQISLTSLSYSLGDIENVKAVTVTSTPNPGNPEESTTPQTDYPYLPEARMAQPEIILSIEEPGSEPLSVYPNPVVASFFVKTTFQRETGAELIVYDLNGRPLFRFEGMLPAGSNVKEFTIDRNRIASGVVYYEFRYENDIQRGKLLIL